MMLVLICGLSGISYGEEEDAITISNATCEVSNVTLLGAKVTVKGTIRANRDMKDVKGWLTINGNRIGPGGLPAIPLPELGYTGGHSFGNLSAGQTKSFSITESVIGVSDGDRCGVYFGFREVDPPPETDPTPAQEPAEQDEQSKVCQVGDVLSPGESCTDPGTGDEFSVLANGFGRYLFMTAGTGISLTGTINGKQRNFVADKRADGKWEIKSVTGGDDPPVQTDPKLLVVDPDSPPIYWTDYDTGKIQHVNLDGSNVQDLTTHGLRFPTGIALDVAGGKMYWTDMDFDPTTDSFINGKIQRANLDGSNVEDLVPGLRSPRGIALGIPSQTIPSSPDLVVEDVRADPATVAVGEKFKLYVTLKNQGRGESTATRVRYYRSTDEIISTEDTQLASAHRNPLAANTTIHRYLLVTAPTTPGTYYYGVCVDSVTDESNTDNNCSSAVSVTVTAPPVVSEDVNEDGIVDVQDLVYVAQRYGQTDTTPADVNDDGVVNIDDLILVAAVLDADAAAPSLRSDALERLTVGEVQLWLSQARQRDLTDPSVRRGILFLEQLLSAMVPKETALLANYPNPFNPETWIPYQLSEPAEVTLTIYAVNGTKVRTLALGLMPAGIYQSRSRAVYWDGRNNVGEPVASGLYFYTLKADDFTATKKMLILK